jgi:positive regulator of sigma E activity
MKNSLLFYWSAMVVMFLGAIVFFFKLLPATISNKELLFASVSIICMVGANILLAAAIYEQNREKAKEKQ